MFFGGMFVGVIVALAAIIIITKRQTKKLEEESKLIQKQTNQLDQEINIQLINRWDGHNLFNIVDYSKINNEVFSSFIFGVEQ